jgi:glycosyltransferase involved in cell wall biosynthesis
MSATLRLGVLSTYPPREDGIATYTRDLLRAIRAADGATDPSVAAITEPGAHYRYPPEVRHIIIQGEAGDYVAAMRALAGDGAQVLLLEHEFGLYGDLDPFLDLTPPLLAAARAAGLPLVTTLHTVHPEPHPRLRATLRRLCAQSAAVTVMAHTSAQPLRRVYGVDPARVAVIAHGVHAECDGDHEEAQARLGVRGRTVLATFGLMHRNKGIDVALRALPAIVARHPGVVYLVAGETHPDVRQHEGEAYRDELVTLVAELGLGEHVRFMDRYLPLQEVFDVLRAADVYLLPYRDLTQASSGTLAYALGCGRAVVSTPFVYAQETLARGRGLLIEPESAASLAAAVNRLLEDGALRDDMRARALAYGREMTWARVGARFAALLRRVAGTYATARKRAHDSTAAAVPDRAAQHAEAVPLAGYQVDEDANARSGADSVPPA